MRSTNRLIEPGRRMMRWRKNHYFWIMAALGPVVLLFLVIRVYPILDTFVISFFRYHMTDPVRPFIGLDNYQRLLEDSAFHSAFVNTIQFTLSLSFIISLLLQSIERFSSLFEIIFYIPVVTPWVPASVIWKWIYDPLYGILNFFLSIFGVPKQAWLQEPGMVMYAIVGVSVWKMLGYFIVVYGVGLKGIPDSYLEAAEIDGASPLQRLTRIIIPLMKPIIVFTVVMSTIMFFNVFAPVYVLTASAQGAPAYELKVMVSEIFMNAFTFYRMGYAGAMSVVLLGFVMILVVAQFMAFREREE
jgi:multiple sugar transport system permease protein